MDAIPYDRAARTGAELMPFVIGFLVLEDAYGIEGLVAEVLERRPPEPVRRRLGDDLDDASSCKTELGLVRRVGDLEFLYSILGKVLARLAVLGPVVDHPVDDVARAVERHPASGVDRREERSRPIDRGARHQESERQIIARVDRKRLDLLAGHDAGHFGLGRIHDG